MTPTGYEFYSHRTTLVSDVQKGIFIVRVDLARFSDESMAIFLR